MSSRISDVHYKTFQGPQTTASGDDKIQLSGLPTPKYWLRGVSVSVAATAAVTAGGARVDFVTNGASITEPPSQGDILLSFPAANIYGTLSFLLPEDSYIEIVDDGLWVTSIDGNALNFYNITLYYT